jgi:hypothetical protein
MGGQSSRDFQPLPLRQAQGMGKVVGERGEPGTLKDIVYLAIHFCSRTLVRLSEDRGGLDVFKNRHLEERTDHLERAGYPEMTQLVRPHSSDRRFHEYYFSVRRGEETTEKRKKGCLPRTVRANHADNLSRHHIKRNPAESLQPSEVAGKILYSKQRWLKGRRVIRQTKIHGIAFLSL